MGGLTVVLAAGNDNADACSNRSPRCSECDAIIVGATNGNDRRCRFSNYGSCVDIFAPGKKIKSAGSFSNSRTKKLSGTSQSAPQVAGAAALYLGENAHLSPTNIKNQILTDSTKDKIRKPGAGSPNKL